MTNHTKMTGKLSKIEVGNQVQGRFARVNQLLQLIWLTVESLPKRLETVRTATLLDVMQMAACADSDDLHLFLVDLEACDPCKQAPDLAPMAIKGRAQRHAEKRALLLGLLDMAKEGLPSDTEFERPASLLAAMQALLEADSANAEKFTSALSQGATSVAFQSQPERQHNTGRNSMNTKNKLSSLEICDAVAHQLRRSQLLETLVGTAVRSLPNNDEADEARAMLEAMGGMLIADSSTMNQIVSTLRVQLTAPV